MTIVLAIDHVIINMMMFKSRFKLAGNKTYEDAFEAFMILRENYINLIPMLGVYNINIIYINKEFSNFSTFFPQISYSFLTFFQIRPQPWEFLTI